MQQHGSKYLAHRYTLDWGGGGGGGVLGQKVKKKILKIVMLLIKLKGIVHSKHSVFTHTHDPWIWAKSSNILSFLKVVMLHIKLKVK